MATLLSRLPKKQGGQNPKKKRRKKKSSPGSLAMGELRLAKLELVQSISVKAGQSTASGSVKLIAVGLPFLKTISASFERIQFLRVRVIYKTLVGTVRDGGVTMGVDWNFKDPETSRSKIACYTPTQSGPVFREFSMTLPPGKLQSRKWYLTTSEGLDGGPGIVAWAVDAPTSKEDVVYGEIWVSYEVILSGTSA